MWRGGAGEIDWEGFKSLRRSGGGAGQAGSSASRSSLSAKPCCCCALASSHVFILRLCVFVLPGIIACVSGLRGACYATFCVCERVGLLGAVGVWARVLPFGRTGALPSGGQYSRVESSRRRGATRAEDPHAVAELEGEPLCVCVCVTGLRGRRTRTGTRAGTRKRRNSATRFHVYFSQHIMPARTGARL